ncbi:unnamed protein product [Orchesella dallaii]|uniref:RRM domain-containing protein n=1 Tax=Orchesella dallaii TaxID=48710 RepID=A0ABP1PR29_9HEXA
MARSSSRSPSPRSENGDRGRRSRRTSRQSQQYRSRSKGESPSPPATEKRERDTPSPVLKHEQRSRSSKSRSVSSSSRSSAVKYGAAQLTQSQSSFSSSVKEFSGSSQSKVALKDPVKIVQVANIAPRATREQMQALFGYVGKIDDIRLYPAVDVAWQFQSKVCFIKFHEAKSVGNAQHLTNTIFIDRVLIVIPYMDGDIPDEGKAVELLTSGSLLPGKADPKLPQHVTSQLEGIPPHHVVITKDPRLVERNLPSYPPLSPTFDSRKIEEIRRTIMVCNIDHDISEEDVIEYFSRAGEVKYFRFCTRDNDPLKFALIEFSEQPAILDALTLNGNTLGDKVIRVHHATQAIIKPQAKSNEAAQKEIEEAMSRQAQNLLTSLDSTVAPFVKEKRRSSRSRSRSPSRRSRGRRRSLSGSRRHSRSRSPHSSSRNRESEKYRSKTKKSRSRSRDKRTSRSRRRSKSGGRSAKSRSISHSRRSRSKKPEEKKKPKKDKEREKERNTEKNHKENVDGIDPPSQKEKRRKSERKSRSPKSESKKRRSRSGSHSRKMSSPGHEKKRSKSKKKKKNSDREPSVDSRSSSKEKRPKKERSESLEREVTTRDDSDSKKGYLVYR